MDRLTELTRLLNLYEQANAVVGQAVSDMTCRDDYLSVAEVLFNEIRSFECMKGITDLSIGVSPYSPNAPTDEPWRFYSTGIGESTIIDKRPSGGLDDAWEQGLTTERESRPGHTIIDTPFLLGSLAVAGDIPMPDRARDTIKHFVPVVNLGALRSSEVGK